MEEESPKNWGQLALNPRSRVPEAIMQPLDHLPDPEQSYGCLKAVQTNLQDPGDDGESEKDRPAGLVSEDAAHAQDLGDQDRDRDDQLVDGADLREKEV